MICVFNRRNPRLNDSVGRVRERHREIKKLGFETGDAPDLTVVTYRYIPSKGNVNSFNRKLVELVQKDGRVFISSTMLGQHFMLRFACLSFRTHLNHVDILLEILRKETMNQSKD